MAFGAQNEPTTSVLPTNEEIDAQIDLLCDHPSMEGEKRGELLRFLIRIEREQRYVPPFHDRRLPPTGKQIMFEFYEKWNLDRGRKLEGDADDTEVEGRRLVGELASVLEKYFQATTDRVVVEIGRGRNNGYRPLVAFRGDLRLRRHRSAVPSFPIKRRLLFVTTLGMTVKQ